MDMNSTNNFRFPHWCHGARAYRLILTAGAVVLLMTNIPIDFRSQTSAKKQRCSEIESVHKYVPPIEC